MISPNIATRDTAEEALSALVKIRSELNPDILATRVSPRQ